MNDAPQEIEAPIKEKESLIQKLKKAWNGKEKLWVVFWVYNFAFGIVVDKLCDELLKLDTLTPFWIFIVPTLVWIIWCMVAMWRCAFNAHWRIWGYLTRIVLVLGTSLILVSAFLR